jgi:DNA primase
MAHRLTRQTPNARTTPARGLLQKDTLEREIVKFALRCPRHVPTLREAGAMLVFTQDWAVTLWEKLESCAPEFSQDMILRILDDKEKALWGQCRLITPSTEHEREELADICAFIARECREKQDKACLKALGSITDKNDYDLEMLKALNEALLHKRTLGSTDGQH